MRDLNRQFGFEIERLQALEAHAVRDQREKETKKHAKELTKYLSFEDVDDFTEAEFEEKNFTT